ncbi:MAG TPA: bifunctional precorrin-2 dehydrogenase/sirohydrochlorin ferrochelatase [Gemmataceae bacterium]|nr:bifunctional precorrin-2 dehydrogenase/sirohydrochlorin ferrochelatase [Gemmataceae bacterium]
MFPLFLNVQDRLCVVIGGGPVGQRKTAALLESGARVRMVCLENRPPHLDSPRLEWITERYAAGHLHGAALVFAAASGEVNQRIVRDARSQGVWVNAADDPANGDFYVPATVRRGQFTAAIGTGGAAPGLAQAVRLLLESQFDEAFGTWVALLSELRPLVLAAIPDAPQRRALLERLCQWDWLERLRREEQSAVRAAMMAEIAALARRSADPV